jgi:putative toxin-antitoxin system antitoxin component (TIGR02293 family)
MKTEMVEIEKQLDREVKQVFKNHQKGDWHIFISHHYHSNHDFTYRDLLSNKMLIIWLIQQGIPYSMFDLIKHYSPFDDADWISFLDISAKSLQRYKQEERNFKPLQSEKIIEVAEVTNLGVEVFGDLEKFRLWLDTPSYALGNQKPKSLLKDSYGKDLVLTELTHINHGILA